MMFLGWAIATALATEWSVPVPREHDMFTVGEGSGPHLRMKENSPVQAPIPLDVDTLASPDCALLGDVTLPVDRAARTLYILTAGQGGLDAKGVAAEGTVKWADGREQALKWLVGEQAWPAWAGATGRGADVIALGKNAGGDVVTASLLTVPLSYTEGAIASINIRARVGGMPLCLLAVTLSDEAPKTVHAVAEAAVGSGEGWFDFQIPSFGGPHGSPAKLAVLVKDGHLAFDNGERARFWGINLVKQAAMPRSEDAEPFARGLARLGFNLTRMHHLDVEGALLNPKRGQPGEPAILPEMLDRFDRMHGALKDVGIYQYAEMWTQRTFLPLEGVPFPNDVPVGCKYVHYAWQEWRDAKKQWFKSIYDRVNPYTGLRYADDPAIALVELSNEDSLVWAWSNGALERLPRPHRERFDELWNGWLRRKYATDGKLAAAWGGPGRVGLQSGETLDLGSVAREPTTRQRTELYPAQRAADLVSFYATLEAEDTAEMAAFVRSLGFRQPLVCGTSFGVPAADALLSACDVIDTHAYWDSISETNVFNNTSIVDNPGRTLERLAGCQSGKPCTMSEVNHSFPNEYGEEAPLFWAGIAARQDLDAVIWFAWSHADPRALASGPEGALDLEGRWGALAQMPAASRLFRGGLGVPNRTFVRWWSPDAILRDFAETPGLWLDEQVGMGTWLDQLVRTSFSARPATLQGGLVEPAPVGWNRGRFVVDTPRVQAIVGRTLDPGREPGALRAVLDRFAAVSLVSLDGEMLGSTKRALLTITGTTQREGTIFPVGGPGTLVVGKGPARLERVHGVVDVRWNGRPHAWALGPDGNSLGEVKIRRVGGGWWRLDADLGTAWVVLAPGEPASPFPISP